MDTFWKEFFDFCWKLGLSGLSLFGVWFGWWLTSRSDVRQRKLEHLNGKFAALREIKKVVDDIPPDLGQDELLTKLNADPDFCGTLVNRLTRLFGLRNEFIPFLDSSFVNLIDHQFRLLFIIETGTYTFKKEKNKQLAAFLAEVTSVVRALERKLTEEHEQQFK